MAVTSLPREDDGWAVITTEQTGVFAGVRFYRTEEESRNYITTRAESQIRALDETVSDYVHTLRSHLLSLVKNSGATTFGGPFENYILVKVNYLN